MAGPEPLDVGRGEFNRLAAVVGELRNQRDLADAAAAVRYLSTMREWSARLDNFCDELEAQGFGVTRDGWSVTIELRPRE